MKHPSVLVIVLSCAACTAAAGTAPSPYGNSSSQLGDQACGSSFSPNSLISTAIRAERARNYEEAIRVYEAVDRTCGGYPAASARFSLGVLYQTGSGGPRDYAAAANWYSKAIKMVPPGVDPPLLVYLQLGTLYYYGKGVPRDPSMARTLWTKIPVGSPYIRLMDAGLLPTTIEGLSGFDVADAAARLSSGRPQKAEDEAANRRRQEADAAEERRRQAELAAMPRQPPPTVSSQTGSRSNAGSCFAEESYCESQCTGPLSTSGLFSGLGGGPNLASMWSAGDCKNECSQKHQACLHR
jgi:hypothetical protein